MRKNQAMVFTAVALLVLLASLLSFCGSELDQVTGTPVDSRRSVDFIAFEPQVVYPGASFELPFKHREGLNGEADSGAVHRSRNRSVFIYVAPLEGERDNYRIVEKDSGDMLAAGAVSMNMPPASELEVLELAAEQIAARYGAILIEAELVGGIATAIYTAEDSETVLEVRVDQDGRGELSFQGVELDGYGALNPDEAEVLGDLATSPLARALTMVPLDLGCVDGAIELPDQLYATLLQPWQMILKYKIAMREPVVRQFLGESRCGFPGHLEALPEKSRNVKVLWDADHSVPTTHLYFPFDGNGQMEAFPP